jgi:hypothetical protein
MIRVGYAVGFTMLQAGRSRIRLPIRPLDFFNWPNPSSPTNDPGVDLDSSRNVYQEFSWRLKGGWCGRLTTSPSCVSRLSRKCENLDFSQTYSPPRRVFFFFFILVSEAIGTAATPGLLCQPRVIVKMIVEKQMGCRLARETEVLGENLPQRYFCPSQNPTWPDPVLNPGRRGEKPETNRLSYGEASVSCYRNGVNLVLLFSMIKSFWELLLLLKELFCVFIYIVLPKKTYWFL